MKVFLIGMPGCGKSTFGRRASQNLSMNFIDLDKEIMKLEQMSINEIFDNKGEAYFRHIETTMLKNITQSMHSFIMATGGGAPCFFENMTFMNVSGITIFIDTDIDFLLARLSKKGISKRPLLQKIGEGNLKNGLQEQLKKRLPFYSQAHITLPYNQSLETEIVSYIKSKIKSQN